MARRRKAGCGRGGIALGAVNPGDWAGAGFGADGDDAGKPVFDSYNVA